MTPHPLSECTRELEDLRLLASAAMQGLVVGPSPAGSNYIPVFIDRWTDIPCEWKDGLPIFTPELRLALERALGVQRP